MMHSNPAVEYRVVHDRDLVLALDWLYRDRMIDLERTRLLDCARSVARALGIAEAPVPVEGYYAELPELTEYFRLMRALQDLGQSYESRVRGLAEFEFLRALATSGLYGPTEPGYLLPRGRDPLWHALDRTVPDEWRVSHLVTLAHSLALAAEDFSLVALAARAGDPVALTAVRESVVLYAGTPLSREPVRIEYQWRVDDQLARIANRFIDTLNEFVLDPLPQARAENAERFFTASRARRVGGRCVMIGIDIRGPSPRYYHWAITGESDSNLRVDEFWAQDVWTTTRYRDERRVST
jgi:hypothetical protein